MYSSHINQWENNVYVRPTFSSIVFYFFLFVGWFVGCKSLIQLKIVMCNKSRMREWKKLTRNLTHTCSKVWSNWLKTRWDTSFKIRGVNLKTSRMKEKDSHVHQTRESKCFQSINISGGYKHFIMKSPGSKNRFTSVGDKSTSRHPSMSIG